ncbi:MAG: antitoxin [Gammaproteobacteria bacterium]|nr:antitoxin [Gammaproteobacteria bacterium]
MANLQVKSIDDDLYESLGRRAAMENRSISQEVISILKAYLSKPCNENQKVNQSFLELCGTWQGKESAENMIDDIRQNREVMTNHRDVNF